MSNPYDHNPYAEQASYQQAPYVQASPYGAPMAQPHPQSTMILVFGILSLVAVQILGPVAWVMGNKAIKEIDANPAAYSDRGQVNAGRIMGIVGTCLMAVTAIIMVIYVIFMVVMFGTLAASSGGY